MKKFVMSGKAGWCAVFLSFSIMLFPAGHSLAAVRKCPDTAGIHPDNIAPQPKNVITGLHLILADSVSNTGCGIYFSNKGVDRYDNNDAPVFGGPGQIIFMSSMTSDKVNVSLNSMGTYIKGKRIALYVYAVHDGIYHLEMTDFQNIDTTVFNIFLIDNYKKDSLDMVRYRSYNLNITRADSNSYGASRFMLAIERRPLPKYELVSFTAQKNVKSIPVSWKTYNEGDYTGFVVQKQDPATGLFTRQLDSLQSTGCNSYSIMDNNPTTGANVYRLKQYDINGNVTYSQLAMVLYNDVITSPMLIYPNPASTAITVNVNNPMPAPNYLYSVYNMSGQIINKTLSNNSTWIQNVSSYKTGIYIIILRDGNGKLIGRSTFVKTN